MVSVRFLEDFGKVSGISTPPPLSICLPRRLIEGGVTCVNLTRDKHWQRRLGSFLFSVLGMIRNNRYFVNYFYFCQLAMGLKAAFAYLLIWNKQVSTYCNYFIHNIDKRLDNLLLSFKTFIIQYQWFITNFSVPYLFIYIYYHLAFV